MTAVLQVATPQGDSGNILTNAGDYLFRYHEDANQFDLTQQLWSPLVTRVETCGGAN